MRNTLNTTEPAALSLGADLLLSLYKTMRKIRDFETAVHELFASGELPGFVHVYLGEEAVAAGVMGAMQADDYITSTHRGHGHCIAKGVDLSAMMAELFGKSTGICKGKGGSMHIADFSKGMLGANGIVGGGFPLAVGAALSAKMRDKKQIATCFFGDGATNEGTFHESLNLASIWDLPCIFVCENNGYAQTTATCYSMRVKDVAERGKSYDMPSVIVDGQDLVAVYHAAKEAVERARGGHGPTLIECKCLRFAGHFEGDNTNYRTAEEVDANRQRDPVDIFVREIAPLAGISAAKIQAIDESVAGQMREAIDFARSSPMPEPEECLTDVYVTY